MGRGGARPPGSRTTAVSSNRAGRGAAWLAHWSGGPGVAGSNPAVPTSGEAIAKGSEDRMTMVSMPRAPSSADAILTIPNLISAARLSTAPGFLWLFSHDREEAAVVVFGAGAFTDFLDGYIARRTGAVTNLGKLL